VPSWEESFAPQARAEPGAKGGPSLILRPNDDSVLCTGLPESSTWTMKVNVPARVGVPEMTPVDGDRVRPGGSTPKPGTSEKV
jgi:hypothetical protein